MTIAAVNVAVFILLNVATRVVPENLLTVNLFLTSNPSALLAKPWTIVTYSFCQVLPLHLLLNMAVLLAIGYLIDKRGIKTLSHRLFLSVYFLSAIAGGVTFVLTVQNGNTLIGSSAAVMGLTAAFGIVCHDFKVVLPFPGPVKISLIVFTLLALGLVSTSIADPGATIVHFSGVLAGIITMLSLTAVKRYKSTRRQLPDNTDLLTEISLKMKTSGFASLNDDERHILVNKNYISPRCDE